MAFQLYQTIESRIRMDFNGRTPITPVIDRSIVDCLLYTSFDFHMTRDAFHEPWLFDFVDFKRCLVVNERFTLVVIQSYVDEQVIIRAKMLMQIAGTVEFEIKADVFICLWVKSFI